MSNKVEFDKHPLHQKDESMTTFTYNDSCEIHDHKYIVEWNMPFLQCDKWISQHVQWHC
jgi:hypothetical protein